MPLGEFDTITDEVYKPLPQAAAQTQPAPENYYGSGPGLDWADLIDVPWSGAVKPVLGGAITALDTLARPVRTYAGSEDLGRAFESIYNPERQVTTQQLREKMMLGFLGQKEFNKGPGFDWGDVADFAADIGVGTFTDPLTPLTLGATGLGRTAVKAGQGLARGLGTAARAGEEASLLAQAAGKPAFTAAERMAAEAAARTSALGTYNEAITAANPLRKALTMDELANVGGTFKGTAPTLAGRLRAGETGLSYFGQELPTKWAAPIAEAGGQAFQAARQVVPGLDPVATAAGKLVDRTLAWVENPSIRTIFGMQNKSAEDVGKALAQEQIQKVLPIYERWQAAGIKPENWSALDKVFEALNPREIAVPAIGKLPREETEFTKHLINNWREGTATINALKPEQQAVIYSTLQDLNRIKHDSLEVLARETGSSPEMGKALLDRPAQIEDRLATLKIQAEKLVEEGKSPVGTLNEIAKLQDELVHAKDLASAVPNYFPGKVSDEIEKAQKIGAKGPGGKGFSAITQGRIAHGEDIGNPLLKGVPFSISEELQHVRYEDPKVTIKWLEEARKSWGGKGVTEAVDAEKAAQPLRSKFFELDQTKAWTEYFQKDYANAISRSKIDDGVKAFGVDARTWNQVTQQLKGSKYTEEKLTALTAQAESLVKEGKSPASVLNEIDKLKELQPVKTYQEIAAEFEKATGRNLDMLIKPDLVKAMKTNVMSPEEASRFIGGAPVGHTSMPLYNGELTYLPDNMAKTYANHVRFANENFGQALGIFQPLMDGFLKVWKPAQVVMPASQMRNLIGDAFRLLTNDAFDRYTAGEIPQLLGGLLKGASFERPESWGEMTLLGGGKVADLIKQAGEQGVINVGRDAEMMAKGVSALTGKGPLGAYNKLLAFRENSTRLAAYAARLRAGDDAFEAGLRVEEAMYNQARISPAAKWLRRTGLAPFISWQAKNIPATVEWAVTNPGRFASALRISEQYLQGEIPDEMLPKYSKDHYNLVVNKGKDANGRPMWSFVDLSNIVPMTDLVDLMKNPGGISNLLGPMYKTIIDGYTAAQNEQDDKTWYQNLGNNLTGRPGQLVQDSYNVLTGHIPQGEKTGQAITAQAFLGRLLSPARVKDLRVEDTARKTLAKWKGLMSQAKGRFNAAQHEMRYAQDANPGLPPEDSAFSYQQQRLQQTQLDFQNAQRRFMEVQHKVSETVQNANSLQLAP